MEHSMNLDSNNNPSHPQAHTNVNNPMASANINTATPGYTFQYLGQNGSIQGGLAGYFSGQGMDDGGGWPMGPNPNDTPLNNQGFPPNDASSMLAQNTTLLSYEEMVPAVRGDNFRGHTVMGDLGQRLEDVPDPTNKAYYTGPPSTGGYRSRPVQHQDDSTQNWGAAGLHPMTSNTSGHTVVPGSLAFALGASATHLNPTSASAYAAGGSTNQSSAQIHHSQPLEEPAHFGYTHIGQSQEQGGQGMGYESQHSVPFPIAAPVPQHPIQIQTTQSTNDHQFPGMHGIDAPGYGNTNPHPSQPPQSTQDAPSVHPNINPLTPHTSAHPTQQAPPSSSEAHALPPTRQDDILLTDVLGKDVTTRLVDKHESEMAKLTTASRASLHQRQRPEDVTEHDYSIEHLSRREAATLSIILESFSHLVYSSLVGAFPLVEYDGYEVFLKSFATDPFVLERLGVCYELPSLPTGSFVTSPSWITVRFMAEIIGPAAANGDLIWSDKTLTPMFEEAITMVYDERLCPGLRHSPSPFIYDTISTISDLGSYLHLIGKHEVLDAYETDEELVHKHHPMVSVAKRYVAAVARHYKEGRTEPCPYVVRLFRHPAQLLLLDTFLTILSVECPDVLIELLEGKNYFVNKLMEGHHRGFFVTPIAFCSGIMSVVLNALPGLKPRQKLEVDGLMTRKNMMLLYKKYYKSTHFLIWIAEANIDVVRPEEKGDVRWVEFYTATQGLRTLKHRNTSALAITENFALVVSWLNIMGSANYPSSGASTGGSNQSSQYIDVTARCIAQIRKSVDQRVFDLCFGKFKFWKMTEEGVATAKEAQTRDHQAVERALAAGGQLKLNYINKNVSDTMFNITGLEKEPTLQDVLSRGGGNPEDVGATPIQGAALALNLDGLSNSFRRFNNDLDPQAPDGLLVNSSSRPPLPEGPQTVSSRPAPTNQRLPTRAENSATLNPSATYQGLFYSGTLPGPSSLTIKQAQLQPSGRVRDAPTSSTRSIYPSRDGPGEGSGSSFKKQRRTNPEHEGQSGPTHEALVAGGKRSRSEGSGES